MFSRLFFLIIVIFWVTMNFLLWDSLRDQSQIGSNVPAEIVWQKILTAPEKSSLEILHHGKKIGYCRWLANVGSSPLASGQVSSDEYQPDGMVERLTGYTLDIEGNAAMDGTTNRLRFDCQIKLSTNQNWQEFQLRASLRPNSWEFHANAADNTMRIAMDDSGNRWQKTFTSEDLQHPETLLQEFDGSAALGLLLGGIDPLSKTNALSRLTSGLKWRAHNHRMQFGHSQVKVFRLEANLIGRFKIYVFVSRVGEILWVELPDEIVLSNDDFTHF